ncbi:hypothetical protein H2200_010724 [Cladophialophora chaetospira]|uniref:Uncharacterized protein n=1 Tax=Cladophialophora chaetospira TaxID=386627 RepID=A0AA39CDR5_9EURO|nr:hypothetical protein H2200_010724 [Cladophialophora chaetospira]
MASTSTKRKASEPLHGASAANHPAKHLKTSTGKTQSSTSKSAATSNTKANTAGVNKGKPRRIRTEAQIESRRRCRQRRKERLRAAKQASHHGPTILPRQSQQAKLLPNDRNEECETTKGSDQSIHSEDQTLVATPAASKVELHEIATSDITDSSNESDEVGESDEVDKSDEETPVETPAAAKVKRCKIKRKTGPVSAAAQAPGIETAVVNPVVSIASPHQEENGPVSAAAQAPEKETVVVTPAIPIVPPHQKEASTATSSSYESSSEEGEPADTDTEDNDLSADPDEEWLLQKSEEEYLELRSIKLKGKDRDEDDWRKEAVSDLLEPNFGGSLSKTVTGNTHTLENYIEWKRAKVDKQDGFGSETASSDEDDDRSSVSSATTIHEDGYRGVPSHLRFVPDDLKQALRDVWLREKQTPPTTTKAVFLVVQTEVTSVQGLCSEPVSDAYNMNEDVFSSACAANLDALDWIVDKYGEIEFRRQVNVEGKKGEYCAWSIDEKTNCLTVGFVEAESNRFCQQCGFCDKHKNVQLRHRHWYGFSVSRKEIEEWPFRF